MSAFRLHAMVVEKAVALIAVLLGLVLSRVKVPDGDMTGRAARRDALGASFGGGISPVSRPFGEDDMYGHTVLRGADGIPEGRRAGRF